MPEEQTLGGTFNKRAASHSQVDPPKRLLRDVGQVWVALGPIRGAPSDLSKQNQNFEAGGFVYSPPRLFVFLPIIYFTEVLNLRFLIKSERENFWKHVTSLPP